MKASPKIHARISIFEGSEKRMSPGHDVMHLNHRGTRCKARTQNLLENCVGPGGFSGQVLGTRMHPDFQ